MPKDEQEYDVTTDLRDDGVTTVNDTDTGISAPDGAVITEQGDPAPKEDVKTTLRDQLSSAFKGEQNEAPPATVAPQNLNKDAEGRWRKLDGTFASTEEVQAFTDANRPKPDTTGNESIIAALPAAQAEQFKLLPAEMQQYVARTMEDLNNRATRYSEYEQLESIIGPRRQAWQQNGMNPLVAMNQLFALSDFASTRPDEFVIWFAENNGLDLDAVLDARDAAGQVSPEVLELRGQVNNLSQTLSQMMQGSQSAPQNDNLVTVQNFAAEKDEGGNLKRPYLSEVMPVFASHVAVVRQSNPNMPSDQVLAKAYEAACWADPTVRNKMQAEIDKQKRDAARQRTDNARRASSSIRGGPNGAGANPGTSPGNLSLRDELQRQFAAHS